MFWNHMITLYNEESTLNGIVVIEINTDIKLRIVLNKKKKEKNMGIKKGPDSLESGPLVRMAATYSPT